MTDVRRYSRSRNEKFFAVVQKIYDTHSPVKVSDADALEKHMVTTERCSVCGAGDNAMVASTCEDYKAIVLARFQKRGKSRSMRPELPRQSAT